MAYATCGEEERPYQHAQAAVGMPHLQLSSLLQGQGGPLPPTSVPTRLRLDLYAGNLGSLQFVAAK
jgi:hypothetical protein